MQSHATETRDSRVASHLRHTNIGAGTGDQRAINTRPHTRLKLSFTWPTIAVDVQRAGEICEVCQKRRRTTVYDRVPISPIPRDDTVFSCWVMDCLGPLFPNQKVAFNYCLVLCNSCSRYPVAFPLRSLTAKSVCNALLQLFQTTGIPPVIRSDCATNFTSQLTRTFLSMLGCSPRFNVPVRPQQTGLCESRINTLKNMISILATDDPKSWHQYLGFAFWALRESPNETTGVPPWVMVYGKLPRGPLAVLKENWCGRREAPLSLGQTTVDYLQELHTNLEVAETYAASHSQRAQQRYVSHYNLRSRPKSFSVGVQVLILSPDNTASKVFSKWRGPATVVVEVKPPHSYIVEIDGVRRYMHADKLQTYHINVDEVICKQNPSESTSRGEVHHCAIVYEHLSEQQQKELLAVLDEIPQCFSDNPGFCNVVQHEIHVTNVFKQSGYVLIEFQKALNLR